MEPQSPPTSRLPWIALLVGVAALALAVVLYLRKHASEDHSHPAPPTPPPDTRSVRPRVSEKAGVFISEKDDDGALTPAQFTASGDQMVYPDRGGHASLSMKPNLTGISWPFNSDNSVIVLVVPMSAVASDATHIDVHYVASLIAYGPTFDSSEGEDVIGLYAAPSADPTNITDLTRLHFWRSHLPGNHTFESVSSTIRLAVADLPEGKTHLLLTSQNRLLNPNNHKLNSFSSSAGEPQNVYNFTYELVIDPLLI